MSERRAHNELGQFIPLHYHYNMLNDTARMRGFKTALELAVWPGARVLELGGGTGVLSFFAARSAAKVWCVERNPELARMARATLALNPNGHKVEVVEADAFDYLPPEPVDVVVCEMIHVAMLREQQLPVISAFKERYLRKFGGPLPAFVPEALIQAVQPVQQSFDFEGYHAPTSCSRIRAVRSRTPSSSRRPRSTSCCATTSRCRGPARRTAPSRSNAAAASMRCVSSRRTSSRSTAPARRPSTGTANT